MSSDYCYSFRFYTYFLKISIQIRVFVRLIFTLWSNKGFWPLFQSSLFRLFSVWLSRKGHFCPKIGLKKFKILKNFKKPILSLDSVIDSKIAISLSIEKVSGPIICCFTSGPLILFRFRILPAFFRKKRFLRIQKCSLNFEV